jgi:cytochrome P450
MSDEYRVTTWAGLPGLGTLPQFVRDSVGYVIDLPRSRGDLVDTHLAADRYLFVSHPALAEQVLVKQAANFTKDAFARDLKRVLGEGLLTAEGALWRQQRRLAQPAFLRDRIVGYADVMVERARTMAEAWRPDTVRDLHADYMGVTLDIVARTLFGADVGDVADRIGPALDAVMHWYGSPLYMATPHTHRLPLPARDALYAAKATLDEVILQIVRARRAALEPPRHDLLGALLAAVDDEGHAMSDAQLRDEVLTMFLAGHETTALALSWASWLLAQHPGVQYALRDELDAVLGDRDPTVDDLPRLRFTDCVAREVLRLYPPAWAVGREAAEDFSLGGRTWPRGIQVWINTLGIHRDPRRFERADAFVPTRWMDGLEKRLPRCAWLPFGAGPRICIGGGFAMMELNLLLATVLRRWHFVLDPAARVVPQTSITLRPKYGVRMRLRPR